MPLPSSRLLLFAACAFAAAAPPATAQTRDRWREEDERRARREREARDREIREERRPGSPYASLDTCRYEVREAENLMQHHRIPTLDTTSKSIEEIATTILHRTGLRRTVF